MLIESPDGAFLTRVGALGERRSARRNLAVSPDNLREPVCKGGHRSGDTRLSPKGERLAHKDFGCP